MTASLGQGAPPPGADDEHGSLTAQVVEPKWVVRVDYTSNGRHGAWTRISDATDAAVATRDVLDDLRTHRPDATVDRIEAFAPSKRALVPRSVLG